MQLFYIARARLVNKHTYNHLRRCCMKDSLKILFEEIGMEISKEPSSKLIIPKDIYSGATIPETDDMKQGANGVHFCALFIQGGRNSYVFELTGRKSSQAVIEKITLGGYGQKWSLGWDAGPSEILYLKLTHPSGASEAYTFAPFLYTHLALVFTHGYVRKGGEPSLLRIMGNDLSLVMKEN